jgi:PAS domain S-box-containing protein
MGKLKLMALHVAVLVLVAAVSSIPFASANASDANANASVTASAKTIANAKRKPVVLVLNSYHIGYDWSDDELLGVQAVLGKSLLNPIVLVEYLDTKRFPDKSHFPHEAELLAAKFRKNFQPDLVLAMDNGALEFAQKYRPSIFPGKPIIFCGINDYTPELITGQKKITGIAENHDSVGTLELALRMFPGTKEVLVVHDYTDTGLAMRNELSKVAERFPNVKIEPAREMRIEKLVDRLKQLHEGQLVVLLSYAVEKSGRIFTLAEVARIIGQASPVPVFAVHASQVGQGIVGGIMMGGKVQGESAARLAEAVLNGQDPDSVPVFTGPMSAPMFDYQQLERFGITKRNTILPPGSILVNTPKSSYQVNKALVWFSVLLIAILSLALAAAIINGRRQLAIRALEEANHAYRHLLDCVGDTIYIYDFEGRIIEANEAASTNSGYSYDELIKLNVAGLVAQSQVHHTSEHLQMIARDGFALFESVHATKDGREFPVEVSAKTAEFRGKPCCISITRDITLRKRTEQELRLQAMSLEQEMGERQQISEQLRVERDNVRALFDAAPVGMLLIDEKIEVVDSNSTMNRLVDKPVDEILGLKPGCALDCYNSTITGYACGKAGGCAACQLRKSIGSAIVENVGAQGIEILHISTQNKDNLWLRFSVEPVFFGGKKHAIVAIDDVSQQRRMEIQVVAEKERLAVTLASLGEGVITTDPQGTITLMNKVAEDLTGWQTADSLGKPLSQVFRLQRKASRQPIQNLDSLGGGGRGVVLEADGHVVLQGLHGRELQITGTITPMHDMEQHNIGQVLVFQDMTEKHELENELFQARKLESLGVLAGGLAHDLNNLLTAIIGNISIAEVKARGDAVLQPFLSRALKASERTSDLTRQLLTFAKGGAPVKKVTSLQNIVKDSAEFALRGSNIRCEYQIPDKLYHVAVDVGQMSQVVNNLVINAKQAMPDGGILRISMENASEGNIGSQLRPGRYVKVSVQDHGVGIANEHLERIFDPYFTTKDTGNGLGLASVHAIIAKHDGILKVESTPGKGTTFIFAIPASDSSPEKAEQSKSGAFRGSGRVLVMDDDKSIIETLGEMLQLIGYEVVTCEDGQKALHLYRKAVMEGCPFKLVIMDLTIPGGMGGEMATKKLLQDHPEAKVIVASGYSDSSVMANYAGYGFRAAIAKPYTISVVSEVLRTIDTDTLPFDSVAGAQ